MKHSLFLMAPALGLLVPILHAQTTGVPEPGVIVYGKVLASDGTSTLPATSLTVVTSFQQSEPLKSVTVPTTVGLGKEGASYYVARINFGNISVVGGNNQIQGSAIHFDYPASPTGYTLRLPSSRVTSDGQNSPVSVPSPQVATFTFPENSSGEEGRGQMVRMDLLTNIDAPVGTYESWATANGLDPNSATGMRTADADGDKMTNEAEWTFGTDPLNQNSNAALHKVVVSIESVAGQPGQKRIRFTPKYSDGSRTYEIHKSTDLGQSDPFALTTPAIPISDGDEIISNIFEGVALDSDASDPEAFYRIEASLNE
ncbi:hypothetical protein [Roseibacillus ishigakijimensis]|uniref:Chitobiase/beta-hexosaminidase C-terminal domain-containing protein n=1 Tax=Roseibacillus ishigakijimensis TaxID=454146 RepID=A0A934VN86_9BACT|nr:hypothetical protein [Roseibacillus ishigakijimensis]MBK1835052.1 hypothetical protein [Roseibacillus ishigakijimensis]